MKIIIYKEGIYMEEILKKLKIRYKDTKFCITNDGSLNTIIYDDALLEEDEEFFDFVYELVDKYLEDEDKMNFAIVYDYLDEIDISSCNIEKEKYIDKAFFTKIEYNEKNKASSIFNEDFESALKNIRAINNNIKINNDLKLQKNINYLQEEIRRACIDIQSINSTEIKVINNTFRFISAFNHIKKLFMPSKNNVVCKDLEMRF